MVASGYILDIIAKKDAPVPKPREVRDTFETLINDNNAAIAELENSIREIKGNRAPVESLYGRMIDRFAESLLWPSLDEAALGKIRDASGGKADFAAAYRQQMADSRQAEIRLNGLTATHGEMNGLEDRMRDLQRRVNEAESAQERIGRAVAKKAGVLRPVGRFNDDAPKDAPKLEEGSIGYFSSKSGFAHVWSWMFNSHYRHGRAIIRDIEQNGVSIVALQKELKEEKAGHAAAEQATQALVGQKLAVEKPFREMKAVAAQVFTEEQIVGGLKKEMLSMLEDRAFFNKVAAAMGESFPSHAIELRAKLEGLDKLERGARKGIAQLQDTSRRLKEPMGKLNKAISRKPGMNVKVDLDKTRKGVKAQQVLAKHKASEIKKAGKSIGDYRHSGSYGPAPAGPDILDIYLGFMIFDMLAHDHHAGAAAAVAAVDPAVVNETLGISDSVAADAGIDVGNLSPALSGDELSGLGDAFNGAALDVGSLDVGTFEVPDVPDISVPDIDAGGFDLGGIDIGGFDIGF